MLTILIKDMRTQLWSQPEVHQARAPSQCRLREGQKSQENREWQKAYGRSEEFSETVREEVNNWAPTAAAAGAEGEGEGEKESEIAEAEAAGGVERAGWRQRFPPSWEALLWNRHPNHRRLNPDSP